MKRETLTLRAQKLTKYFLEYIENNDIPDKKSEIKFSNLGYNSETTLFGFFSSKLNVDLLLFEQECKKYKEEYPKAYQKIQERIEKRKNHLSLEQRIAIFMNYIETNDIPTAQSKIKFCDLDPNVSDKCIVGIWLQDNIAYNIEVFYKECEKYKEVTPTAYQKISLRLSKKLGIDKNKIRLKMIMDFYENNSQIPFSKTLRFCDIDESCVDKICVYSYISIQASSLENFKKEILTYKETHPKAYQKLNDKIKYIETCQQTITLSFEERFRLIINHLEENPGIIAYTLKFNDLDPTCQDINLVAIWFNNELHKQPENILMELEKYKKTHPKAYQKLHYRFSKIKNNGRDPLYTKKMELFLKYITNHSLYLKDNIKFIEVDPECNITGSVIGWFKNQLYSKKELSEFIEELSKYQELYPIGYQKVSEYLNNSKVFLNKKRTALLNTLKNLRSELITYENTTVIQETHLIKQKGKI